MSGVEALDPDVVGVARPCLAGEATTTVEDLHPGVAVGLGAGADGFGAPRVDLGKLFVVDGPPPPSVGEGAEPEATPGDEHLVVVQPGKVHEGLEVQGAVHGPDAGTRRVDPLSPAP